MRNVDDGNFKENLLLFPRHILPCNKKTFSSRLHRRNRLKCCWQVNPQKGTKSIWMPGQLGRLRQCKSARVIVIGEICNFPSLPATLGSYLLIHTIASCETQPPASIGWVALSSLKLEFVVPVFTEDQKNVKHASEHFAELVVNWAQLSNEYRGYVDPDMLPGSYAHRKYIVCMVWNII